MNDFNILTVSGRLTRDAETKTTNSGKIFTRFSIASNTARLVNDAWENKTAFLDCVAWDKRAESISKNGTKGAMVILSGKLNQDEYENSEGKKVKKYEVIVDKCIFIDRKKSEKPNVLEEPTGTDAAIENMFGGQDEEILF
jgi:single-strand DNA-binding protein